MTAHNYMRYRKGCRCFTCRLAKADFEREVREGIRPGYVPAGPVQQHVAQLRANGLGVRRLVAATGVSRSTLQYLHQRDVVHASTAARLLAFNYRPIPPVERYVPAVGTHRRIQAMCALGWSLRTQILRSGLGQSGSTRLLVVDQVQPTTAVKIQALYDRLSMTPAPAGQTATRARQRALRERFFPPLAWDVERLDDPDALPCLLPPVEPVGRELELHVQHLVAGHPVESTSEAVREIIRRMPDAKSAEIARLAQTTSDRVSNLRSALRRQTC